MLFLTVFYSLQFSEEIMSKRKPPLLIREYCPTKIGIIAGGNFVAKTNFNFKAKCYVYDTTTQGYVLQIRSNDKINGNPAPTVDIFLQLRYSLISPSQSVQLLNDGQMR